jgi:hypothetical protein
MLALYCHACFCPTMHGLMDALENAMIVEDSHFECAAAVLLQYPSQKSAPNFFR